MEKVINFRVRPGFQAQFFTFVKIVIIQQSYP